MIASGCLTSQLVLRCCSGEFTGSSSCFGSVLMELGAGVATGPSRFDEDARINARAGGVSRKSDTMKDR